jgi:hypothetical protein
VRRDCVPVVLFAELMPAPVSHALRARLDAADDYMRQRLSRERWFQKSEPTWLYLMGARGLPVAKIGQSLVPSKRLADIGQISPVEIILVATFEATQMHEKALHHAFRDERVRGEWFSGVPELTELSRAWGLANPDGIESKRRVA